MAATNKILALWSHPAGPKTVHFWAPTFKWGVIIANLLDSSKSPEELSYPQQAAIAGSALVWAKYSTVVTPKNWNLFSSSIGMAATAGYQLARKIQHDFSSTQNF
ncbi:mitochondrial pyruvate carrier 3 [Morus notabilis]|uniref:mitochondrial pyruvate carrier 3 n=1 Tax=Morus notabilis TaxID=981085 RepID=UPI000CECF87D|nr:mitochondrial pyruvate carrier 3 [Morus notabilis]